jgi:predicted MPP superfamily phosphohydrolase
MVYKRKTQRKNRGMYRFFPKKQTTLKNRINHYVFKKEDINTPDGLDKNKVISEIIDLYKQKYEKMGEKDEHLNWISNDLVFFIGYKVDLISKKDKEGVKVWDALDRRTQPGTTEEDMKKLLDELPLYYLLSFLGYAYYSSTSQE